jgi:hypothetical protein
MNKEYLVKDLFFTTWDELRGRAQAEVFSLLLQLRDAEVGTTKYGVILISILRRLRKNPQLVNKINVEQAVDIFNDLKFLKEPFYKFRAIRLKNLITPEEKMAKLTFDHFIYADNEYSSFLSTQDPKYLLRLVATLYQAKFDKENVESIAAALDKKKIKEWLLTHTFFTYAHVREFVTRRCKTLMPPPPINSEEDIQEVKATPTGGMWLKLKHRLAETPAFQGYDKAGSANMYAALDYLEDLAQLKEKNAKA